MWKLNQSNPGTHDYQKFPNFLLSFIFLPKMYLLFLMVLSTVCVHAKSLQSCLTFCNPVLEPTRLLCPWDSQGKNTEVHCHALLKGIFLNQRWNQGLLGPPHWQVGSLQLAPPGKLFLYTLHKFICSILMFSVYKS